MGQFDWYVMHDDTASVQQSLTATAGSDEYRTMLTSGGGLLRPGASQVFARRIA